MIAKRLVPMRAMVAGSGVEVTVTIAKGTSNPEISEAFTVAPEVVYSPIVLLFRFETNRSDPDTAIPIGIAQPRDQGCIHGSARGGVFA
jgi:hypothetical protein